ncbi:ribonuclease H-like domain-containing protein [Favolaschia claudopus]|uniref:Ribonuclease H-like domain-containing protein n=1 Tax=Favolaschia claudopus TaxID=2862362 RepID=A0AAW0BT82_9AGAR
MVDSALPCSRRIGLEFDLPKFQLIHFVSPRRHKTHYTPLPLKIGDIVIQPTETAKLLGVMLDFKLSFRSHVELAQSRGTKATLALSRISTPILIRTCASFSRRWSSRAWSMVFQREGTVWVAKALGKVQRQACKLITGALRTTATDTLDFHANVLPVHIRLNRSAYNAATRLASLPSSNPIRHTFRRCRRVPRFHRSPIHQLIHAFPIFRSDFETIDPQCRLVPLPAASVSVHIAATKDIARADLDRVLARGGTCIFTDGSGFEDGAGAAAVVAAGRGEGIRRQKHLGSMSEHTVFESEVCGAILALDIIADIPRLTDVDIFLDCQPAIVALSSPKPQPEQYLLAAFHAVLARILRTRRTRKIRLRWVPAHVGIAGNELVDYLAKEAAQGTITPLRTRIILFESPLPTSRCRCGGSESIRQAVGRGMEDIPAAHARRVPRHG